MSDPTDRNDRWTYDVGMTLPPSALEVRDALVDELHRSDRRIGVGTSRRELGLYLAVLGAGDDEDAARRHALRLVAEALGVLGLDDLAPHITVEDVKRQRVLPGGTHLVGAAPPLSYRGARLPDGGVLNAACEGPLGEWFAYVTDNPGRVMAGRGLPGVLNALFELPWGKWEQWAHDAIEALAGHRTSRGVRYPCPCCDCLTLQKPPPGTNATCEVCVWEDDKVQFRDPDCRPGANRVSLREARENYRHHGTSDLRRRGSVRRPHPDERPPGI